MARGKENTVRGTQILEAGEARKGIHSKRWMLLSTQGNRQEHFEETIAAVAFHRRLSVQICIAVVRRCWISWVKDILEILDIPKDIPWERTHVERLVAPGPLRNNSRSEVSHVLWSG